MAITQYPFRDYDLKKYKDWLKSLSEHGFYYPFVTVRSTNKFSRRHQMFCSTQDRIVHLLSDGERRAYQGILWQQSPKTIYDQFALDPELTMLIATELNYAHPRIWELRKSVVMTTDLLVIPQDPNEHWVACSFKYWDKVYEEVDGEVRKISPRTWQKFEIEKQFWNRQGVQYKVITDRDYSKELLRNIEYLSVSMRFEISDELRAKFLYEFKSTWIWHKTYPLRDLLVLTSNKLNISLKQADICFRQACYTKELAINMESRIAEYLAVEVQL